MDEVAEVEDSICTPVLVDVEEEKTPLVASAALPLVAPTPLLPRESKNSVER